MIIISTLRFRSEFSATHRFAKTNHQKNIFFWQFLSIFVPSGVYIGNLVFHVGALGFWILAEILPVFWQSAFCNFSKKLPKFWERVNRWGEKNEIFRQRVNWWAEKKSIFSVIFFPDTVNRLYHFVIWWRSIDFPRVLPRPRMCAVRIQKLRAPALLCGPKHSAIAFH